MNAIRETRLDNGDRYRYRQNEDGTASIVKCESSATEIAVPEALDGHMVTQVGELSFERLLSAKRIVLPSGLVSIGARAFRSCVTLREVVLPQGLRSIGAEAFRTTALERLAIPASCVDVEDDSFCLQGSWQSPPSNVRPSTLASISVEEGNPELCLQDGMLCRRCPSGLRVIMCEKELGEASLTGRVREVLPAAFTGVTRIGTLRIAERVRSVGREVVFPSTACRQLFIECNNGDELAFPMPDDNMARKTLAKLFRARSVNPGLATEAFDAALSEPNDKLFLAKAMLERLSSGRFLSEQAQRLFRFRLASVLEGVCLNFGSSSYWRGFDQLFECGLLGEGNVVHVIDVLTRFDDAAAAGYLLQEKRRRYGEAAWDYGI